MIKGKAKDGAASDDTIIVGDKHVLPEVPHTPESDVPNYDFDFLNSMSIPERSSEFDDSQNINMTFTFTSDAEYQVDMSQKIQSDNYKTPVIIRKTKKVKGNDYSGVNKIDLRDLKDKYYIIKDSGQGPSKQGANQSICAKKCNSGVASTQKNRNTHESSNKQPGQLSVFMNICCL